MTTPNPMTRFVIEAAKEILGFHVVVKTNRQNPSEFTVHDMSGFRPTAEKAYPDAIAADVLAPVLVRAAELRDAAPNQSVAAPGPAPDAPHAQTTTAIAALGDLVGTLVSEIAALKARLPE
jgi:hypothetical protein